MSDKTSYLTLQQKLEDISAGFYEHPVTPWKIKSLLREIIHEVNVTAKQGFCEHNTTVDGTDWCIRGDIEYTTCVDCGQNIHFKIIR